jgi:N-acetylglucosaminyl-diphospho-decaprenol L-rhamnosyltransferase
MTGRLSGSVTVVIVSYQSADWLPRCLAALPEALPRHRWQVVVVDNASSDGSAEVADRLGATVIRSEQNVGFARAANLGARGTETDYLIFLNPDTVAEPGSLSRLLEVVARDPSIAIGSALLKNEDGTPTAMIYPAFYTFRWSATRLVGVGRLGFGRRRPRRPRPGGLTTVHWAPGACLGLRRETFSAVSGFDERFFLYAEDMDLCLRARQLGRIVIVGQAPVFHQQGQSARHIGSVRTSAQLGAALITFMAKHDGRLATTLFTVLALIRYTPNMVWERATGRPPTYRSLLRAQLDQLAQEWRRPRADLPSTGLLSRG